ncbi:MAG: hypothetical protein H6848_07505 [Caulobacterales bacterium]|nr:hypothetical protein [Caulobacterales bacterium]
MGAVTGIVAGFVTAAGALALYRYAQRRGRALRDKLEGLRARAASPGGAVIDLELDPATGVFKAK